MRSRAVSVGIIMGSASDWETMRHAAETLTALDVPHEVKIVSAHRTPRRMVAYAEEAAARGLKVIIAGAGGAAHLPGMVASLTASAGAGGAGAVGCPVGQDSLLSIVQMPAGIPVGTLAIGKAGATNAACWRPPCLRPPTLALSSRLKAWRQARPTRSPMHPD
jgi:5-(carboxyamino)imidazole ribonucleotide mutase